MDLFVKLQILRNQLNDNRGKALRRLFFMNTIKCSVCGAHPLKIKDVKDPESTKPVGFFVCSCGYEMCVEYEQEDKCKYERKMP